MPAFTQKSSHRAFLVAVFTLLTLSSCSQSEASSLRRDFGDDSYYYMALNSLDEGDEKNAVRQFTIARDNGTYYVAKRSAEALTQIGTLEEKISSCIWLAENYAETDSLYIACSQLEELKAWSEIVRITMHRGIEDTPDSIIKIRLTALYELQDAGFEQEVFDWITLKPSSYEMYQVFQDYQILKEKQYFKSLADQQETEERLKKRHAAEKKYIPLSAKKAEETDPETASEAEPELESVTIPPMELSPRHKIMNFRMTVLLKDYQVALKDSDEVLKVIKKNNFDIPLIYSDLGKAHLYGTESFQDSAKKFDSYAGRLSGEAKFYAYFYAARLYSKAGRYQDKTISRFRSAIENATDGDKYDNALYYLLETQMRISTDDIIASLKKYGSEIHNPSYFDDFFEPLSLNLLRNQRWQSFYDVWQIIDGYASEEISCKYAYIAGRLIEEGLAKGKEGLETRQAVDAFSRVLYGNASTYYKVCAIERLNIKDNETVRNIICYNGAESNQVFDKNAEILMRGYCRFNFPQKVYQEWQIFRKRISTQCSLECAQFLQKCGEFNGDYNVQSLRIAARTKDNAKGKIPDDLIELSYPRYFSKYVSSASKKYGISESIIYALIRSESFFDAKISSIKGANGLTQLMKPTADEEAKKLGLEEYDVNDPQTNINLGVHYLSSLISRSEGNSTLLALFAYNAGLSKVRSWVSMARDDWLTTGKHSSQITGISMDLFLETIPFKETSEYGRKLTGAAALYNWIYKNESIADTVRSILLTD